MLLLLLLWLVGWLVGWLDGWLLIVVLCCWLLVLHVLRVLAEDGEMKDLVSRVEFLGCSPENMVIIKGNPSNMLIISVIIRDIPATC